MIRRDFHGYRLEDAIRATEAIIGKARINNTTTRVELITGHGVIQTKLIELFKEYGIDAQVSWTNSGMISAIIE